MRRPPDPRRPPEIGHRRLFAFGCAVLLIVALAGCGGGAKSHKIGGAQADVVDIYSDLPLQGAAANEAVAINNGIELALSQYGGRAGQFTVKFTALDDSTAASGRWDPYQTEAMARKVASDPHAVYDIGDFDSGASELSIPILNEAGIAQVSPSNTYVGLTTQDPGSAPGEPDKYYPTGNPTFFRLVPRDSIQALADLQAMADAGCVRVALANDGTPYGLGFTDVMEHWRHLYGIDIAVPAGGGSGDATAYAAKLKRAGIDCFEFAGGASHAGVALADAVHAVLPAAKIFVPSELCTSAWTNPRQGGVAPSVDRVLECTQPLLKLPAYRGGATFVADYAAKYGVADPSPWAIYGYEAMKLGLDTIARLGAHGDDRAAIVAALHAIRDRHSVIGTYGFDAAGDTTLHDFGLYAVRHGNPSFLRTLTPDHVPSA